MWISDSTLKKKFLRCTDCRSAFVELGHLNSHIARTGHNEGEKISELELAHAIGLNLKKLFQKVALRIDLSSTIKQHRRSTQ